MDNTNNEIPKHRKKVKKSAKKSTHKHHYEVLSHKLMFKFGSISKSEEGNYWVELKKHCTICNKTKEFTLFLNKEEYMKLSNHD